MKNNDCNCEKPKPLSGMHPLIEWCDVCGKNL